MKVLVVGGSKGLGSAFVDKLSENHEVLAISRTSEIPLDLEWTEELITMHIKKAIEKLEGLDALVVSSGMGIELPPLASTDKLKELLQVNCIGPITCYKAALKALLKSKGKVMMVTSTATRKPGAGSLAYYGASKGALNSWVLNESRRAAKKGISIFVLQPGWFDSPMTEEIKPCEIDKRTKFIPFKRFGNIKEIAEFGVGLLEQSNWVTAGSIFECSGGA